MAAEGGGCRAVRAGPRAALRIAHDKFPITAFVTSIETVDRSHRSTAYTVLRKAGLGWAGLAGSSDSLLEAGRPTSLERRPTCHFDLPTINIVS